MHVVAAAILSARLTVEVGVEREAVDASASQLHGGSGTGIAASRRPQVHVRSGGCGVNAVRVGRGVRRQLGKHATVRSSRQHRSGAVGREDGEGLDRDGGADEVKGIGGVADAGAGGLPHQEDRAPFLVHVNHRCGEPVQRVVAHVREELDERAADLGEAVVGAVHARAEVVDVEPRGLGVVQQDLVGVLGAERREVVVPSALHLVGELAGGVGAVDHVLGVVPAVGAGEEGVGPHVGDAGPGELEEDRGMRAVHRLVDPDQRGRKPERLVEVVERGEGLDQAVVAVVAGGDPGPEVVDVDHAVLGVVLGVGDEVLGAEGRKVVHEPVVRRTFAGADDRAAREGRAGPCDLV